MKKGQDGMEMRWERDMDGVRQELDRDGTRHPGPLSSCWVGRCWTCRFGRDHTFGTVICSVTGRRRSPCSACDVPQDPKENI